MKVMTIKKTNDYLRVYKNQGRTNLPYHNNVESKLEFINDKIFNQLQYLKRKHEV